MQKMSYARWLLMLVLATSPALVRAQAGTDSSAEDEAKPPAITDSPSSAQREQGSLEDRDRKHPMGDITLALKVGFGRVLAGDLNNPTYSATAAGIAANLPQATLTQYNLANNHDACTIVVRRCHTPARDGALISLTLHLGGEGFGWDIEPYLLAGGQATSFGAYTGPSFDIHIADPLYFGFGFGGRVGYVAASDWKYGADIFGRIPAHVTWYVTHNLALEVEAAFGAGVSGYASEPISYTNPQTGKVIATAPNFRFGVSRAWDVSVGVRFP